MLFRFLTWSVSGQPGYLLTSRPYVFETGESLKIADTRLIAGELVYIPPPIEHDGYGSDSLQISEFALVSGKLGDLVYNYQESLAVDGGLVSGKLGDLVYGYIEELTVDGGLVSGKYGDINYGYTEELTLDGGLVEGTHG